MSKVVSNKRQLRRLVELLQKNQNIARGICSKTAGQKKWEEFALELNSLGPPQREWHKWQRVWADLKCKIKKKKTENDYEISSTGNRPNRFHHFSDMEEAVIEMLELNTEAFRIEPEAQCEDSLMSANESLVSLEDMKFDPEDFSHDIMKSNHSKVGEIQEKSYLITKTDQSSQTDECKTNLGDQSPAQKQFYENMTDLMRDIKRSINNIEDHIKKGVEQKDELLELKRQKLKAYKENMKSQRVDRKAKLKLKAELVALKKQKQNTTSTKS